MCSHVVISKKYFVGHLLFFFPAQSFHLSVLVAASFKA